MRRLSRVLGGAALIVAAVVAFNLSIPREWIVGVGLMVLFAPFVIGFAVLSSGLPPITETTLIQMEQGPLSIVDEVP